MIGPIVMTGLMAGLVLGTEPAVPLWVAQSSSPEQAASPAVEGTAAAPAGEPTPEQAPPAEPTPPVEQGAPVEQPPPPAAEQPAGAGVGGTAADAAAAAPASTEIKAVSTDAPVPQPAEAATPAVHETIAGEKKEGEQRPWSVTAETAFHMLAVVDPDPETDQYLIWRLQGAFELYERLRLFLLVGVRENFWAEPDESGLFPQDTRLGLVYGQEVSLAPLGLQQLADRKVTFKHRLFFWLPTSRSSIHQDLYLAPRLDSEARMKVIGGLELGLYAGLEYHFHKYAEQAGLEGGMLTQFVGEGLALAEYTILDTAAPIGEVLVGLDGHTAYSKDYPSRETYESEASSTTFWHQDYGWDLYVDWTPVEYLTLEVSLEHGGNELRDGIVNTFFVHRDETELVFKLIGTY